MLRCHLYLKRNQTKMNLKEKQKFIGLILGLGLGLGLFKRISFFSVSFSNRSASIEWRRVSSLSEKPFENRRIPPRYGG